MYIQGKYIGWDDILDYISLFVCIGGMLVFGAYLFYLLLT